MNLNDISKKILANKYIFWGGIAIVIIIIYLVITNTDLNRQLINPSTFNIVLLFLLIAAIFLLLSKGDMLPRPDPAAVLEWLCDNSPWMRSKGYNWEKIEKDYMWVESGKDCFFYTLSIVEETEACYLLVKLKPTWQILDHIDYKWTAVEKRRRLGLEFSVEDIKEAVDRKKAEEMVKEG